MISLRSAPTSVASNRALRCAMSGRIAGMTGGEKQSATLPLAPDTTGQVCPALPVPGGDQRVQGVDVARGQRAGRAAGADRGLPEYPGPDRGWQAGQQVRPPAAGV